MAAPGFLLQEIGTDPATLLGLQQGATGLHARDPALLVHAGGPAVHPLHRPQVADPRPGQGVGAMDNQAEQTPQLHEAQHRQVGPAGGWRPFP